jgi:membrane protein DedA with SNARE-associated domain
MSASSFLASSLGDGVVVASTVTHFIERLSGPWLYVAVGVLTFLETASMLFFIPGEITLILAGVAASGGSGRAGVNIFALLVLGCAAAIAGDATGFWLGRRYGPRLRHSRLGRKLGEESWAKAEALIRKRRGIVVLVGRWVGLLRAVMPATAGMTGMNYKKEFLPYDVVGAVSWASLCVYGGYRLGEKADTIVKRIGWVAGGVFVVGGLLYLLKKKLTARL